MRGLHLALSRGAAAARPTMSEHVLQVDNGPACHILGEEEDEGILCDEQVCEPTRMYLCDGDHSEWTPGMTCILQEGLTIDGKPVYACGQLTTDDEPDDRHQPTGSRRSGHITMKAAENVSDLGLTMADLEAPIPFDGITTRGVESASRTTDDGGCEFVETADQVEATLTIPGLRGQPAAAMKLDLTIDTATITVFGRAVWSCVLRGKIFTEASTSEMLTSPKTPMQPLVRLKVKKQPGAARWGGLIKSIGEDSLLGW